MNYLVQRGKVRGQVIHVPEGLPELLSDITREVLRCQPTTECLCQFIIDYLHSVIVSREKADAAHHIIERALHTVDEIIADMCICDIGKMKADHMAAAMEECFKRFLERKRCEEHKENEIIRFDEEDILDELISRCRFTEHDLKISRPLIEDAYNRFVDAYMQAAEGTEGTEALYQYFKQREQKRVEERSQKVAAVKIQAIFRGYKVRRSMFLDKDDHTKHREEPAHSEEEKAATRIQKAFRKHHQGSHPVTVAEEPTVPEIVCDPPSQINASPAKVAEEVPVAPAEISPAAETAPTTTEIAPEVVVAPQPVVVPEPEPEPVPVPAPEPEPEPEPEPVSAPVETAAEAEPPAEENAAVAEESAPAAE